MSELQVFSNAEFGSVRSITVNGEPYFVGKDVAEILGYANTRNALAKHVDEEDRMDGVAIRDSIGREQTPALINESGLYSLILSSRLPSAKRFKRWVTSEVLPAIRKHGVFAMDDIVNNTDALIEALQAFKAERLKRRALEQEAAVQKQQLAEMRPKASYYDVVLNSPSLMAVSEFAKDYGWSAKRMNQYLHEKGVQYKQGGKIWLLYQKYAGCGYTSTKTHAYMPVIAAGAKTIAFGDFSYYWIADRQGRSFKRLNELYAANGQVGFLGSQRVDGKLVLSEAVKVLAQKAGS